MSITSEGWRMFVTLVDSGGNTTTKTYELAEDGDNAVVDYDTAVAAGTAIRTALAAVTDSVIQSYGIYEFQVEGALALPAAGVQIENQALLEFDVVGHPTKHPTLTIPAPKIGVFNATTGAGSNVVNTSAAIVTAYRDLFRTDGYAMISDGEVANSLIKGKRIHRKSNRG